MHRFGASSGFHRENNLATVLCDAGSPCVKDKTDAFTLQRLLQFLGDVGILSGENVIAAVDDSHAAAKPAEHLPELQADVPSPEHEQVLGHFRQLHYAGIGQIVDLLQ